MLLPHHATSGRFRAGFVCGMLLFLAANVRSYWVNPCFWEHGWCEFGFPFTCGYGFPFGPSAKLMPFDSEIFWGGVAANFCTAFPASVMLGRLCDRLFGAATAPD